MIKIKVVVILMVAIMGITAVPIQASEKQGDSKKQENKAFGCDQRQHCRGGFVFQPFGSKKAGRFQRA